MLEIGSIIDGKYKILSKIGSGGMSTVYLAINAKANKPWAIKEVRKDGIQNFEVVRQSLIVETDLLKKLSHSNLPSIVDIIEQDDNFLIVMDYIEGITLNRVIQENGPQKQDDVVKWAIQICDVLQYLHSRKPPIIYRDMKPSNIMLKYDGSIVLIDFGTAREFKEKNIADTTCLGTQGYAAPEQFGGYGQTDARTDIYCLGATMYHLLTGHNPSEPPYEMYPISHWNSALSSGLESIVLKSTQKNPKDRFQTAEEFRYALENYKDLDRPIIKKYKRKIGVFITAICLAVACGISSACMHIMAKKEQKTEYEFWLNSAEKSTSVAEQINYYLQAVDTDASKEDAYQGLVDCFTEDGAFSDEEEQILLKLNVSVKKYLQNFENKNAEQYADFCFDVGNMYWFYYSHPESRQSNAVPWFQTAALHYEKIAKKEMELKRCAIYVEIGKFDRKIVRAQIEGTDAGMYSEYWSNLLELKNLNEDTPDRELVTLRLYREIITRSTEYSKYLCEDGVAKEEIETVYNDIREQMKLMKESATNTVQNEIEKLDILIQNSKQIIESSYTRGK